MSTKKRKRNANNGAATSVAVSALKGRENTNAIIGNRVVKNTQDQYAATFNYITSYCTIHYPDAVNEVGELILSMEIENLEAFMGDMGCDRDDGTCKASSTFNGYATVIKFYYRKNKVPIDDATKELFKGLQDGFKRKIADKKDKGIMKNFEGKVPVSFVIFASLSKLALFAADCRSTFASFVHLFLILCWNLFARSCSVADLRTHHFSWENDCLVIDMSKHKADQAGDQITLKHLYANPYNPEHCVILALALHIFAISFRPENEDKTLVFQGSPCDIFTKWLPTALQTIADLGYALTDFGTHSFRKGIASFCAGFFWRAFV